MINQLRSRKQSVGFLMTVLLFAWQVGQPLQAATFYWDGGDASDAGNSVNGDGLGGGGAWDTTTANWWPEPAGALTTWGDTSSDIAIFTGPLSFPPTLNTVTLTGALTANQLQFWRSGYTLTGGTSLTLAGANAGIFTSLGDSAIINSLIAGTDGLTVTGGGSLRLGNAGNTYTGVTTISNGTLIISDTGVLGADVSAISILTTNATPQNTTLYGFGGGSLVLDGTSAGFDFSRNVNMEGRGPIGQRSAAIISLGNNTLSGTISTAISPLAPVTLRNSAINSVNGTLSLSGTVNTGGTSATTFLSLGGINSAGSGNFNLTGVLAGTGSIEKAGGGTILWNPSSTSGFSGTLRISASGTGQESSVLVTQLTAGSTSIFGTNTVSGDDPSAIDLNGGILEFHSENSLNFNSLTSGKNVYQRASSTVYAGPGLGGQGINSTITLGTYRVAANTTGTFNSRNGYGFTFQAWTQESSTNPNTITNNMGGTLLFTAGAWGNSDTTARTLTIGGNGNTVITGSITASGAAHVLAKSGSGNLTIIGTASTYTGNTNITAGAVQITDFRSINNNTSAISLGNATTTGGNLIIGGTGVTPTAAGLTTSKTITLNTTSGSNSIYANQTGSNPVVLNGAITKIAAATTGALILGGTNAADNIINVVIPVETTPSTGGVTKIGSGTWVLNAANTYAGATTIQNGTIKLRATAAASDVIKEAASNTIVFSGNTTTGTAGGTLEFRGFSGAATTETLGALTPTAGAATIRLLGNDAAASLTFTSLGATAAASSVNFDTSGASGGIITLTGQAATSATNLPGTANFLGHLYLNGADFAVINGSAQVVAPTYGASGNFREAATALTSAVHNKLTDSFSSAAITVSSLVTNSKTLTMSGNLTVSTGGILQSGGAASIVSDSGTSRLILGAAAATNIAIRVDGASDVLNIGSATNPINIGSAQTGGLTKNGAGTLVFFAANAQTGTVNINEGTIELNGLNARLAAAAGVATVIRQNASLDFNTGVAFAANPTVAALDGAGTIQNIGSADVTVVQTGAGTWAGSFNETGSGKLNVSKLGTTGAPTWSGISNYTGVTTIGGTTGSVTVDYLANGGQNSAIGASSNAASNLVFSGTTGGIIYRGSIIEGALTLGSRSATTDRLFTLSGTGATLSSTVSNNNAIIWGNTGTIVHGTNANRTLFLAGTSTGDNTFNPQLTDSTGFATSLTKQEAGQWNLGNSNNTYTGATTVANGILGLNANGALPANSPLVLGSTTTSGILQMSGTLARDLAVSATAGVGTITWGGTTGGGGFAAHSTPLTVTLNSGAGLSWGSGGFVGTGGTQALVFGSASAMSEVIFTNAIDLGAAVRTITVNSNTNTGGDFATLSGVLSGAGGGILKNGTGVLRLTGASIYTGTTEVQAGTVVVTSLGSSTGSGSSGVGADGVTMDNSNAIVLGNATTTGGILQYVGSGETSDRKIRLRGTTAGNQIHADGSGPLILTNVAHDTTETGNKTLSLRGSNTADNMITSALTDNGAGVLSVTVDGSATWILTNSSNTYTGTTTVGAGALGIGSDTAIGATLTISNGNVFAYGGDRTLANTLNLGNNATSAFIGNYSLTFNGTNNLAAGANNVILSNSVAAGKAVTFNGLLANSLTATRAWTMGGNGETIINGDFTTSTAFGVNITFSGNGILTLGTNGATSNWNQAGSALDLDRGTLRFTADNAIPSATAANTGLTLSPELATFDTATVDLNGTTQTITTLTATTDGTVVIDNTSDLAATLRFGANDTAVNFGSGSGAYSIANSGTGALSIVKLGNTSATFAAGLSLGYQGATRVEGGTLTLASPVNGTTSLAAVNSGSVLALTGGIASPGVITNVVVENGGTLSLLDGAGNRLNGLINLQLGSTGGTLTTLNLNVGDSTTPGDNLNTDLLSLIGGGTLSLFAGNKISFNLTDAGLNPNQEYVLLDASAIGGGFLGGPLSIGDYVLGGTPGGFTSINLTTNSTTNQIIITTGDLITGDLFWRGLAGGGTDSTWNASLNNWSQDKGNTTLATTIPGQGTDVIFAIDSASGAVATTLEQNFKINSLTFEAGTSTPASVTIGSGAVSTNRLEVAPQNNTDGVAITAGGPASVTISAPFRLGTDQTWTVADSASVLTISGALLGDKQVVKTGSGKVILSAASDPTFNGSGGANFTVNGGNLEITNVGALGTLAVGNLAPVTVNSGGAFYYNGTAGTVANDLTLGGGTLSAGTGNQTYSGAVNVSGDSFINMAENNGPAANTARNITLSGALTGNGSLTIDSNNTVSSGSQIGGTLTINNAGGTWDGDLFFNEGTVTIAAAASAGVLPDDITFNSFGRYIVQGVDARTIDRAGTLNLAAGAVGEFQVDNTTTTQVTDFTVNQNGLVTLGAGGTGASLRVALVDTLAKLNLTGGVLLGGNSSISLSNNAARVLTINSVISDGGSGYSLAINDDAGAWAQTNGTVRLAGLNTFTGAFALGEGIVEFNTVTNAGGAASSLGQGSTISLAGGILRFTGSTSQSTNRAISTTASSTLSADGTGGASITYSGAITQATDNGLTLTGTAGSLGVITGGITQVGDAADLTVNGGTWTHATGTTRIGDDLSLTGATTILNLNSGVFRVRDDFTVTAGATLNLNGTGALSFSTATLSADASLRATAGGVINLGANAAVLATDFDGLRIGVDAGGASGVLNMGAFSLSVSEFILGNRNLDREGIVNGVGVLTVTGNLDVYEGTINASLASSGSNTFEKFGVETVTLKGDNSGLNATGSTIIYEGTLELDYTANTATKLRTATTLDLRGGTLLITGNAGLNIAQSIGTLTLASSGSSTITVNPGVGREAVLNMGSITRVAAARAGVVRFNLPVGSQSSTNGITTTASLTNGILGGFATVKDSSGTWFATKTGDNVTGLVSTTKNDVSTWVAGDNITDAGTGFTGTVTNNFINTLRFDAVAGSTLNVSAAGTLSLGSGAILVTNNVTGNSRITGGSIASAYIGSGIGEIIVIQDSSGTFELRSAISGSQTLTKAGTGTMLLAGYNSYTGGTELLEGILQVSGGNAIGDTSLVSLATLKGSTLQLLADETIGRLQGGQRGTDGDFGVVALGGNNLTINHLGGNTTYAGFFTGSGVLTLGSLSNSNLNLTNISTGFTGTVVVNGGLFQMSGVGQVDASSFVINNGGALLLDNNGGTRSGTRILDSASVTLNSAAGTFAGELVVRGLAIRTNQNASTNETIGNLVFQSGASYLTGEASGTTGVAQIIASNFIRNNNATVMARGRALGLTTGDRNQFRIGDATNQTTFISGLVGGAGAAGSKTISIVPWAIGQTISATATVNDMGDSLVTYDSGAGFRPLNLATEYDTYAAAAATSNVRESLTTDLTALSGTTVNALVIHNNNTAASTLNVTGSGSGQALQVTSGAFLFTLNTAATASSVHGVTLGGFDNGISVGGTNEYLFYVVNPSSSATTPLLSAVIDSTLVSVADITKSGRGTLLLTGTNTAGGGARKTTINEGVLEIGDLDNIGGSSGQLVFGGGTLRLSSGWSGDDFTERQITLLTGGGTLDTNGIDLTVSKSLGGGVGSFTKRGAGLLTLDGALSVATYTGDTNIVDGGLALNGGTNNRLSSLTDLTLGGGTTSGLLRLGNSSGASDLTVASLSTAGTGTANKIVGGSSTVSVLTIDQSVITTFSGDVGGANPDEDKLALVKSGVGSLTLSGAVINYTGSTTVNGGTLNITGSTSAPLQTSGLVVAAGATFNVVNGAGQGVDLGAGPLNLGAGLGTAILGLELGSTSDYDHFFTSGAATTANQVVFNLTGLSGFGAGNYDLLAASGGLNNATYSIGKLSGSLTGVTLSLNASDTLVQLSAAASSGDIYWNGTINNSWIGMNGINTNFASDLAGTTNANGTPGAASSVFFSTSNQTGTNINTTLDAVFSIADLTFNNSLGSGPLGSILIAPGTGGSLTIANGIEVQTGAAPSVTISAPVVLGGDQTWTVTDAATALTVSGGISGTASLTKAGDGILRVIGTSSYSGATNVNAGILAGGAANAFNPTSAYTIGASGTLALNGFAQTIGSLSGVAGANLVNGAASGNVVLTVGDATSTTFAGSMSNAAAATLGLTKAGTGTLTLSGTNTFTGATIVRDGVLLISGSTNTGAGGIVVGDTAASRGRLLINSGADLTSADLDFGSNATAAGAGYQSGSNVTITGTDGTNRFALGNVAGGYGYYQLSGGVLNTARLTAAGNNFAGATGVFVQTGGTMNVATWSVIGHGSGNALVDISGGTYNAGGSFALNHVANAYSVVNVRGSGLINRTAGTITLMQGNANSVNNVGIINLLSGGTIRTSTGGIAVGAGTGSSGNISLLNVNGGTLVTNAATTTLVGVFANAAHTATSGAYIYSGGLTIDTNGFNSTLPAALLAPTGEGVASIAVVDQGSGYIGAPLIKITGGSGVGATAIANMVDDGTGNGTFKIASITITNPGTGYLNTDVLTLAFGDNTATYTTQATFGAVVFNGGNTSGGIIKTGEGTLTLTGASTYTGGTSVTAGTLALGLSNALADAGDVTVNGGTLNVATFNDTVATVSLQAGSITGTTGVLTSTAAYDLRDGTVSAILAGSVGLNKTTAGNVTLAGANLFSGAVSVTAGTLFFSGSSNLGDGSGTNTISVNGGTLSYTGSSNVDLGNNRVLTVGASGATLNASDSLGTVQFTGGVNPSSSGNLTKTGAGTVVLGGTTDLNGGQVTVSNGTLRAEFGTDGIGALTVSSTGVMNFGNGAAQALGGLAALTLNDGARLGFDLDGITNDSLTVLNAATATGTIILDFFSAGSGIAAGTYNLITATGGLNAASYILGTGISGWNLVLNKTDTLVTLDATPFVPVYWRGGQNFSWNTLGSAAANWTTDAAGLIDATQVPQASNTVVFSAAGAPFSSGTEIATTLDAAFTIDSLVFESVPATVTAVTINPGTGGSLALVPVSTTAGIEIKDNAGLVTIAAPLSIGSSQTWLVSATGAGLVVAGDTVFTGSVTKSGAGVVTLSGNNSGAGGLMLSGGSLNINSATALGTGLFTIGVGTTIDSTGASAVALTTGNAMNWAGSFTFTGTRSLDLGAGAVTMPNHTTVTVNGQTLTVGGVISDNGNGRVLTKAGAGTLVLGGTNTYSGGFSLLGGTLHLNNAGALGSGLFTIGSGTTFDNISGGALTLSGNVAQQWNGAFTFTGTDDLNVGTGSVTLSGDVSVTTVTLGKTLTVGGVMDDGAGTFALTKSGTGTLVLAGSNTYGGNTVLNEGALVFTSAQNLSAVTNGLTLGAAAGSTSSLAMQLDASATFGGAFVAQTSNSVANTITIGAGQTLRINGSFTVGYNSAANTTTKLTVTGADGTLTIGAAGAPTNANFQLGNGATSSISNAGTLDMSGLGTFYANLGTGTFRVGSPTNSGGGTAAGSTLILAANSTIIATTITSDSPDTSTVTQAIKLGSGANIFNATTITIGGSGNRARGTLDFNGTTGTIVVRGLDGVSRSAMNVQNGAASTSAALFGTVDFTGHNADLLVSTLAIGGRSAGTTGGGTGLFTFDTGVLDATAINLAARTGSTLTTATVTGTLNLAGGAVTTGTVTMSTNSVSTASTSGDAVSTVNISGSGTNTITTMTMGVLSVSGATNVAGSDTNATVNVSGGTTTVGTLTMGANNSTAAAVNGANTATSTLNISGGTFEVTNNLTMGQTTLRALNTATATISVTGGQLTVGGNIQYTNGLGTENNTVTLDGGILDMTGGNIGSAAATITFNAQSGTLRNLNEVNGGATVTKTTTGTLILDTANAFTGQTVVSAGVLAVSHGGALGGTTNGTSVAAGGTLSLSGGITVAGETLALAAGAGGSSTLNNQSGNNTWTANVTVDTGSDGSNRVLFNSDSGKLTVSGNVNLSAGTQDFVLRGDGDGEISGQITGSQRLFKSSVGTGTWILSGDNSATFTGRTTIGNGALQVASEANLGATPGSFVANQLTVGGGSTQGTLKTTGTMSLSANRGVTVANGGGAFDTAASTTLTIDGVVAGAGAVSKAGAGTLKLTAANTISGPVSVLAGVLEVNNTSGSGTGTGDVTLSGSDTTLAGSGTIAGSAVLGSDTILAPGEGAAASSNKTLTFTAATSITAANTAQIQLGVTSADSIDAGFAAWYQANPGGDAAGYLASLSGGIADTTWNNAPAGSHDYISASGTIVLGNTSTGDVRVAVSLNGLTSVTYGSVFNLLDWSKASTTDQNSLSTMSGGAFSLANLQLEDFSGALSGFAWDTSVFDSYGILVVVPEPSRALFLLLGLFGLLMRRRRARA
ncbi:MAG: autotransporter-associated beta strand repeat-containing protein [Prosthecobacter sp.]|nr:autotransporter-associated beta strand repeat-containing protein [Prosthecobacter sp.]